jgi:hypothetical protein
MVVHLMIAGGMSIFTGMGFLSPPRRDLSMGSTNRQGHLSAFIDIRHDF